MVYVLKFSYKILHNKLIHHIHLITAWQI
uniref:Uncharacterized protein n=1 Tax=Arundo donax TaxID=35708 RepID=A0A0A9EA21_ARUDO